MLKVDLHLHTCDCRKEAGIGYDAFELIDAAAEQSFDVISITNHDTITYNNRLKEYAGERGIVLIPGIELTLHGKHILAYNVSDCITGCTSYANLQNRKNDNSLFIAPHPFYPARHSLGKHFFQWQGLFDAVEFCHFYTKRFGFNGEAVRHARQYGLPMVGTSDSHSMHQLGTTYSMIDAEKNDEAIIAAIKKGAVEIMTKPLSHTLIAKIMQEVFIKVPFRQIAGACSTAFTSLWQRQQAAKGERSV